MTQWDKLLKSLGFTDSESKIYLTSLETGPASVQDIARRARVSRVTTYAVIESLAKQGLMSSVEKGKKKNYVSESPERLISFVHNRVKVMEATLHEMESSIQDLKLIQRGEKPVVKLFEGPEALKAIQDDVLRTQPKETEEFGNLDEIKRIYSYEERKDFFQQLARINPKARAIFIASTPPVKTLPSSDIIVLPQGKFDFAGDIYIYGKNKVAFSTFRGKQISVLIDSEEIVKTMRAIFDHLWECVGPKKK